MYASNIQAAIQDDFLDYFVIIGNIKEILSQIDLRISVFQIDGKSEFIFPVNNEMIKVEYIAEGGKDEVTIGISDIIFTLEKLGGNKITTIHKKNLKIEQKKEASNNQYTKTC